MANVNPGLYIPTTSVWDVSELYNTDVTKPEFKELLVRMYQNLNNMSLATNNKDSAMYDTQEFVNGQTFFPNPGTSSTNKSNPARRNVFRKVINFGPLPSIAPWSKSVPHDIGINYSGSVNGGFSFTRIYGCANNVVSGLYIPLPYASAIAANVVELSVDKTNVIITAGKDISAFTKIYVILEYLKQ